MRRRTSRELAIAAAGLAAAFGLLALWVRFQGPIPGDRAALAWATRHGARPQAVSDLFQLFDVLGTPAVAALTTLTAVLILLRNVGLKAVGLLLLAALVVLAERPLSRLIAPTDAAAQLAFTQGGFPSGHVLYVTAVFGMIAWLGVRHKRPEVAFVAVTCAVVMGVLRVAAGSHLVSDVLGAYLLGGAWLCAVLAFGRRA